MTEVEQLKHDIHRLHQENHTLQQRVEQYHQAYLCLQQQVAELKRHRFGTKSERVKDMDSAQLSLFDSETLAPIQPPEETVEVPAHQRRKKSKRDLSHLPRDIKVICVPEEDRMCACGCQKTVVRYETKELLHYQPAQLRVIEQRREVVACRNGCAQAIQTAPAPKQILPKMRVTESLLAHTLVSKLHHRQPLYHLEKYSDKAGVSRETMARWHIQLMDPLQPLMNLMKDEIMGYDVGSMDATSLQVLKEPGRLAQTKSYVYCIRGGPPERSSIVYAYNAQQHKPFVDNLLEGFAGHMHMDADPFFDLLLEDDNVQAVYCNAHSRRKFEAIAKQAPGKKGLAYDAVGFYRALYHIERQAKQQQLTPALRYALRLEKSKPILEQFHQWLQQHWPHVLPESPLGKAFRYTLKHWDGLCQFLADGRLEFDNNLTEQEIKPFVIARKNFMFAHCVNGAHALCVHMSLIRTALKHQLDPYAYYVHILKRIPHCQTVEDYQQLLPWNVKPT